MLPLQQEADLHDDAVVSGDEESQVFRRRQGHCLLTELRQKLSDSVLELEFRLSSIRTPAPNDVVIIGPVLTTDLNHGLLPHLDPLAFKLPEVPVQE